MKQIAIFFLILTGSLAAIAQGMWVPRPTTINTPMGNVTTTTMQYTPMYYGNQQNSLKYQFTIVMADDSTFSQRTTIDISEKKHTLKVKTRNGKKLIAPSDTREVYRITMEGRKLEGIPADSCWLFHSVKGKINCYAYLAEEGYNFLAAIQQGEGPILPLTKANLLAMVGTQDPKLQKMIDRGKFASAIKRYNTE
ncbi:MAG: hypothetical protein ACK5DD_05630 [Cyclobacteriaceae bacterium]